jgi:hypothetical protein
LIGRLLSLLFDIHESQVRAHPSLVDALYQLVAGLDARRPAARDGLIGLLLKVFELCGEVHRCPSTGPTGYRTLEAIQSRPFATVNRLDLAVVGFVTREIAQTEQRIVQFYGRFLWPQRRKSMPI